MIVIMTIIGYLMINPLVYKFLSLLNSIHVNVVTNHKKLYLLINSSQLLLVVDYPGNKNLCLLCSNL